MKIYTIIVIKGGRLLSVKTFVQQDDDPERIGYCDALEEFEAKMLEDGAAIEDMLVAEETGVYSGDEGLHIHMVASTPETLQE